MQVHTLLARLYFVVLKRRYRISIKGEALLKEAGAKLILPNHQSHIDPQLLAVMAVQYCDFVPVISEKFLNTPVIGYFVRAWNAIAVSDLKYGNRDPNVLKKIFSQVTDALKRGKTVIIYPSGQITDAPVEKIRNKQSAYVLVAGLPDNARVIGTRISGLWGSMWSVAWGGKRPNFVLTLLKGIFYVIANLFFLVPKRDVTFEFVDITKEAREQAKGDRRAFNAYLEDFYNVNGPEEARYIKHFFFFPESKRKYPENLMKT